MCIYVEGTRGHAGVLVSTVGANNSNLIEKTKPQSGQPLSGVVIRVFVPYSADSDRLDVCRETRGCRVEGLRYWGPLFWETTTEG